MSPAVKLSGEELALAFVALCKQEGIFPPRREFQFAPPRKFRFDYCWPIHGIALEVEGGVWTGGRHTRGSGFLKDIEKYNLAALQGYQVFRCTPATLCTSETVSLIREALKVAA